MQCCWPIHHQSVPSHAFAHLFSRYSFGHVGSVPRLHDLPTFCHWVYGLLRRCVHFSQELQLVKSPSTLLFHIRHSLVKCSHSSHRYFHHCLCLLHVVLQSRSQQRTWFACHSQFENGIQIPLRKFGIRLIHFSRCSVPANDCWTRQETGWKHWSQSNEMLRIRYQLFEVLPRLRRTNSSVH